MKNYVQPELIFIEKFSSNDVILASEVDLTETDHYNFSSTNPWGGEGF